MTTPDERYIAIVRTEKFLSELWKCPSRWKAKDIRDSVRKCLKHYPTKFYLDELAEARPDILEKPNDPP